MYKTLGFLPTQFILNYIDHSIYDYTYTRVSCSLWCCMKLWEIGEIFHNYFLEHCAEDEIKYIVEASSNIYFKVLLIGTYPVIFASNCSAGYFYHAVALMGTLTSQVLDPNIYRVRTLTTCWFLCTVQSHYCTQRWLYYLLHLSFMDLLTISGFVYLSLFQWLTHEISRHFECRYLGPLLLTWFNFNRDMDS